MKITLLTCTGCGAMFTGAPGFVAQRDAAAMIAGWTYTYTHGDRCPDCQETP